MPGPLLLDLSHTSHTRAHTGIQRVCRSLHAALGDNAVAVTFDPYGQTWRQLERWEQANVRAHEPAAKRGARWPVAAKVRGRLRRLFRSAVEPRGPALAENSGLLMPEVFSPAVAQALPEIFSAARGPRVAIFHDAIALKFPELTPTKTVARFPAYLAELLAFDGIAAVSEDSRTSLLDYWQWLGAREAPPVATIPLAVDREENRAGTAAATSTALPVVLSVGSVEGRKNHLALLDACEQLWSRGLRFELHLIGLAQLQTGAAALARIRALQVAGRPLRYDGPVNDAALHAAYAACAFTVYPSLMEGFGLPVLESLARGRPCICAAHGALGESARGGGCIALPAVNAPALALAIERLLTAPVELARLASEARGRTFKSWSAYADEVRGWMRTLARRR